MGIPRYLLGAVGPMALKAGLYYIALKWRAGSAKWVTCFVLGGISLVVGFLPAPFIITLIATIAIGSYLCSSHSGLVWLPDCLAITLTIEGVSLLLFTFVVSPLAG